MGQSQTKPDWEMKDVGCATDASTGPRTTEGLARSGRSDRVASLAIQPIQPMPGIGAGQGFSFSDLHTMNLPGAPGLPQNPFADAAWWRQMYGSK
jgi:hypothetical protein